MNSRECRKCKETIPYRIIIEGKRYDLPNRKFCLNCSPFKQKKTKVKECRKCKEIIPNWVVIDGKERNLCKRKFCLKCSPFGKHNTKVDIDKISRKGCYSEWSEDDKKKNGLCVLKRGLERKRKLIELAGGKCKNCDYCYRGSERALSFHHRNPDEKLFGLCQNNLFKKWEVILEEFQKCDMLCLNCHAELEDKIQAEKNNYRKTLGII